MAESDDNNLDGRETGGSLDARVADEAPADEERLPEVARWTHQQANQMRSILEGITPKLDFASLVPKIDFSIFDYMKPILEQHTRTAEIINRSLQGVVRPPAFNFVQLASLPAFKQFEQCFGTQAIEQLKQSFSAEVVGVARPNLAQIFQAARAVQPLLDEVEAESKRKEPRITVHQVALLLSLVAVIIAALTYWNDVQGRAQQGRLDAAELQHMQEMTRQQQQTNEQLDETRRVIVDLVDRIARVRAKQLADEAPASPQPAQSSTATGNDVAPSP